MSGIFCASSALAVVTGYSSSENLTYARRAIQVMREVLVFRGKCAKHVQRALRYAAYSSSCDGPLGCFCSSGLSLREWKVRPNQLHQEAQQAESAQEAPTQHCPFT